LGLALLFLSPLPGERIGSARDGVVTAFIPDLQPDQESKATTGGDDGCAGGWHLIHAAGREAGIGYTYYGFAKKVLTAAKQNGATRIV
jgi:hypothetical protein